MNTLALGYNKITYYSSVTWYSPFLKLGVLTKTKKIGIFRGFSRRFPSGLFRRIPSSNSNPRLQTMAIFGLCITEHLTVQDKDDNRSGLYPSLDSNSQEQEQV